MKIEKQFGNYSFVLPSELQLSLEQNNGVITTTQANKIGISNERLRLLVKDGKLKQASYGIYMLPSEFVDEMYIVQQRKTKIIYSHDTALYLNDLTDRDPLNYVVTVPAGYNSIKLRDTDFTIFTIKKELHKVGITQLKTIFGNNVITYGMERTICDCLRSRNQMDIGIITDAVKRYVRRKDKDLNTLMQMAEIFQVTKLIRSYLEVLL